jgi:hypothetical protein
MKKTGEWGRFFDQSLNPFAYNEGSAQEFFPLSKKQALEQDFHWREAEEDQTSVSRVIPASELPDTVDVVPDDILNWAVKCEQTGRIFRIIKQELTFYREHSIPIPHTHPNIRFENRVARYANAPVLYARTCMKCLKDIQTTYAPDRSEIVYCEDCYLKEVY